MSNSIERIRTLALVGQSGSGKTSLAEALLAKAGAIPVGGSVERGTTACGNCCRKRVTASGTTIAEVGETPKDTALAFSPSWSTSSSALRSSACAARARANSARPGWVGTTPVGVLRSSRARSSVSKPRTLRVIAGCDTPSLRAAARMPPDSTTAMKSLIWLSVMSANRYVLIPRGPITVANRDTNFVILRAMEHA